MIPNHFSSFRWSSWQSAVSKMTMSPAYKDDDSASVQAPTGLPLNRKFLDFKNKFVAAAAFAAHTIADDSQPGPNPFVQMGKLALRLAEARLQHDDTVAQQLFDEFNKFGDNDPRWLECVAEYISHFALTRHGGVPYRPWTQIGNFVADTLPDKCRIGILGDWGTGDARAQAVLHQLVTHEIDIFIHLGDIYYSCTPGEANTFFSNLQEAFGAFNSNLRRFGERHIQVLTLCGNHDVYAGGSPYYSLISRLGQPASFFCLKSKNWQLLAGDTGYADFDPLEKGGGIIGLRDFDQEDQSYSEVTWHRKRLEDAKASQRRTIFMTHHQPFTFNAVIGNGLAVNPKLLGQIQPFLENIDLWLWGHEHNQVVYESWKGVRRGRCVGASAVPVPANEPLYLKNTAIRGVAAPAKLGEGVQLGIEKNSQLYRLGFAVLDLDGKTAKESYYEFDTETNTERLLFSSTF